MKLATVVSVIVPSRGVLDGKVNKKHTNCMTSGRACSCECGLCRGYIAAADAGNRLLDFTAIGTADGSEVCGVWLLVDGRKETRWWCGKDAAREGEEGDENGSFAGEHVGNCCPVGKWLVERFANIFGAKCFAN